jgi:succinate dehydrogenase/fumarate reductase flavoprotein subunit
MADQQYDAIVVGSGISGGWAAKELTQKYGDGTIDITSGEFTKA